MEWLHPTCNTAINNTSQRKGKEKKERKKEKKKGCSLMFLFK